MKTVCILLISFLFFGCTGIERLNNKIYEIQKQSILESPYKSAIGTTVYVEAQKDFRLNKLPKLLRNKIYSGNALKDTIFMTESFDAICMNCPSDWMKVLLRDTVYSIRKMILGHRGDIAYDIETEPFYANSKDFQYELRNSDLIEIVGKIRNNQPWKTDPLQYGSDNCNDGDYTVITVIYPDEKIEAMYVRCWMPSLYRNRK